MGCPELVPIACSLLGIGLRVLRRAELLQADLCAMPLYNAVHYSPCPWFHKVMECLASPAEFLSPSKGKGAGGSKYMYGVSSLDIMDCSFLVV